MTPWWPAPSLHRLARTYLGGNCPGDAAWDMTKHDRSPGGLRYPNLRRGAPAVLEKVPAPEPVGARKRGRRVARHVCFLETGRAKPSRDMLLLLATTLDVPLRERNALLLAGRRSQDPCCEPRGATSLARELGGGAIRRRGATHAHRRARAPWQAAPSSRELTTRSINQRREPCAGTTT